jgi:hypothetical protein
MQRWTCLAALLFGLCVHAQAEHLSFRIHYQGLLSAGAQVDIAVGRLNLPPDGDAMGATLSTEGFDLAEFLLPIRLCYVSRLDDEGIGTRVADWWSRIGAKASRGQMDFDPQRRLVTRRHAERKLKQAAASADPLNGLRRDIQLGDLAIISDQDLDQQPFPEGANPMDRLAMLQWLRRQTLGPGTVLHPPASDGRHVIGYTVVAEAEETLDWNGAPVPTWRLRLTPEVDDDGDTPSALLWLSRDAQRLPVKMRAARALGRFEAIMLPQSDAGEGQCHVPETEGLELP